MFLTIALILIVFWLVCVFLRVLGGVIHIVLLLAAVMFLLHITQSRHGWHHGPRWGGPPHGQRWNW